MEITLRWSGSEANTTSSLSPERPLLLAATVETGVKYGSRIHGSEIPGPFFLFSDPVPAPALPHPPSSHLPFSLHSVSPFPPESTLSRYSATQIPLNPITFLNSATATPHSASHFALNLITDRYSATTSRYSASHIDIPRPQIALTASHIDIPRPQVAQTPSHFGIPRPQLAIPRPHLGIPRHISIFRDRNSESSGSESEPKAEMEPWAEVGGSKRSAQAEPRRANAAGVRQFPNRIPIFHAPASHSDPAPPGS